MAVDQRTIARQLKLSTATVCRSLRNDAAVHPETRARVAAMALRLGYRQRVHLRNPPRSQKHKPLLHLGVLIEHLPDRDNLSNVVWGRMLQGMSHAAAAAHTSLHVQYVRREEKDALADAARLPPMLAKRAVGGLVMVGNYPQAAMRLLSRQFLCLQMVHRDSAIPIDCVDHDDQDSCLKLIDHLVKLGHRRIGFAAHGPPQQSFVQARYAGYASALARHELPLELGHVLGIYGGAISTEETSRRIAELARGNRGVAAWVCVHDGLGYGVMRCLQQDGLRVPDDLSVCGFDNLNPPPGLPKLTSIEIPFESLGAAAVQRVTQRLASPALEPIRILFCCKLIEGQTTGRSRIES